MKRRTLLHIAFWACYVLFKTYLNFISVKLPDEGSVAVKTFFTMLTAQTLFLVVKLPMVYALFRVIDSYLSKKTALPQTLGAISLLFIFSAVAYQLINHFIVLGIIYNYAENLPELFSLSSIVYAFFMLCFVAGVATTFKLANYSIIQKEQSQEIMKKKLEAELRFLKAQTNPHFLFNTLNNIYALARKKSDDTADVVMKLSKLLRFMLYESENASIPITNELRMIEDYINLEKIRYDDRLTISYYQSIDDSSQLIAPLLLLPFVENAFKHGVSETRLDSFINIEVTLEKQQLEFMIENPAVEKQLQGDISQTGLGNTRRQLELMYPEHLLKIENDGNRFKVLLKINLQKYAAV